MPFEAEDRPPGSGDRVYHDGSRQPYLVLSVRAGVADCWPLTGAGGPFRLIPLGELAPLRSDHLAGEPAFA